MGYLHNPILAKQHPLFVHQRLQAYLTRANNKYKIMRGTARYNKFGGTNGGECAFRNADRTKEMLARS